MNYMHGGALFGKADLWEGSPAGSGRLTADGGNPTQNPRHDPKPQTPKLVGSPQVHDNVLTLGVS